MSGRRLPGSFRDPSGFVFVRDNVLYRHLSFSYKPHYDRLMASGLYRALVDGERLVAHQECAVPSPADSACYKVIRPEPLPFISYPYEWCFSQLKDAALITLAIQKTALEYGLTLKDASAYNIQFRGGRPVLIDTLSFETYVEGKPWTAYRQFCRHFLGPLAIMAYCDARLNSLARFFVDGIPLELVSRLLPTRTRLRAGVLSHIHLHARYQTKYAAAVPHGPGRSSRVSRLGLAALVDHLRSTVTGLVWKAAATEWGAYYSDVNYSERAWAHKREQVDAFLAASRPRTVWDMGANDGRFSRIASARGVDTLSIDADPVAVEKNYRTCRREGDRHLLPLRIDLTNPSPALGWASAERSSLLQRGPADTALALALIHHLAIVNNVPLRDVAEFFRSVCRFLVIEFVPKTDSQVQRLLRTREDVFPDYTKDSFERAFGALFSIEAAVPIRDSERTLYLMQTK